MLKKSLNNSLQTPKIMPSAATHEDKKLIIENVQSLLFDCQAISESIFSLPIQIKKICRGEEKGFFIWLAKFSAKANFKLVNFL